MQTVEARRLLIFWRKPIAGSNPVYRAKGNINMSELTDYKKEQKQKSIDVMVWQLTKEVWFFIFLTGFVFGWMANALSKLI